MATKATDHSDNVLAPVTAIGRVVQRGASNPASVPPSPARPATGASAPIMSRPAIPRPAGTYVADNFTGEVAATNTGTFALAQDGEPAGLARITLAMREPARRESPAPRRLVGLAGWAAALGILGAILAIRAGVGVLVGAPSWFFPTESAIGIMGVGLTMAAFLTARARMVPWTLLGLASCALLGAFITTLVAF